MDRLTLATSRAGRRIIAMLIALILLASLAGIGLAQEEAPRTIRIGETVTGTLSAKNFAQVYTFDAAADNTVSIIATSKVRGLTLAVLLTNAAGATLASSADLTKTEVAIRDFKIPAAGAYYITVMRGTGVQGTAQGDFTLALTGSTAAAPATVTLAEGMSITLNWIGSDDMSLEVRDPVGGSVNFRTLSVPSGGRFTNNGNSSCARTSANPSQTVNWPKGNVPGGSYEIIVYYNQVCQPGAAPNTEATASATAAATQGVGEAPLASQQEGLSFAVTVTVDGKALEPIRGTLNVNQQWVASFVLAGPDQVTVQPGGPNLAIDLAPFGAKISAPVPLNNRTSINGSITSSNPADAWSFQVAANSRPITITMAATSGSLDPLLVLLAPDGSTLAFNDDAGPQTRNAEIANQQLAEGRYTIVATRFALQIGGTEGNYTLTISSTRAGATPIPLPTTSGATQVATQTASGLPQGTIQVTLTWNTRADLRLLVRDPQGQSLFSDQQTTQNGGNLDQMGNFKCTKTTTTPVTYAHWSNSQPPAGTYEVGVWQDSRCQDTGIVPQFTLSVSVNGKEVFPNGIVQRADPKGLHFLTTFTIDANLNATAGPGGIVTNTFDSQKVLAGLPNAQSLALNSPVTGTIDHNTPFVLYTYAAKAGDKLRITMKTSGGNLDTQLFLLGANGVQINQNDDMVVPKGTPRTSDSQIDQVIAAEGTYVIVATRYGVELGGTSGSYELTIAQVNR